MLPKKKSVPFAVRFYGAFFAIRQRLRFAFAKAPILLNRGSVLHRGKSFVLRPAESSPFVRRKTGHSPRGTSLLPSPSSARIFPGAASSPNSPFPSKKQSILPKRSPFLREKQSISVQNGSFRFKSVRFGSFSSISVHFRPFRSVSVQTRPEGIDKGFRMIYLCGTNQV